MPPTVLAASIAAMAALHFLLPLGQVLDWPWRVLGIVLIVFGSVYNLWSDALFKKHRTTVKPYLVPAALVSEGPFRFSRNPMYLGMVTMTLGLAFLLGSLSPLIVPVCFAVALDRLFIPIEERSMERAFGESWEQYRQRVRRWL